MNIKPKLTKKEKEITQLKTNFDNLKKTGDNNVKYLINLDRNERRKNILILEKRNLTIQNNEVTSG